MSEASCRIYPKDALTPLSFPAVFGNDRPVEIDLGCGKGRFLLAHAQDHPDTNFLGIDRMLRRIRKVDRKVVRAGLPNVRLFRMDAYYAVTYLIPPASVSAIYILFPDPWPKMKHHDHRLFNPRFLNSLHSSLKVGAVVHVATDHLPYFKEIQGIMEAEHDRFEPIAPWEPAEHERTDFELLFRDTKEIGRASYRAR